MINSIVKLVFKKTLDIFKDSYGKLKFLIRELKVSVYYIEGEDKCGGRLVIYHVGRKIMPDYFFNKFYAEPPVIRIEATCYFWQITEKLKVAEKKAHLLFVRVHKLVKFFLRNKFNDDFIVIPEYIKQSLDVHKKDEESIKAGFHRNLIRRELKKIERYGYTYEFSRNPEKLRFFYDRMFVPLMKKRHGHYAHIESFEEMRKLMSGGVLLVKRDSRYVAGVSLHHRKGIVIFRRIGLIDADATLLKEGAITAAYYFLIKFTKAEGFKKLELGYTKPILSDGILFYKNKWGTRIEYDVRDASIFMLKICNLNDRIKKLLIDNPVVTVVDNKLGACLFSDTTDIPKIDKLDVPITQDYFKGLEFVKIVTLN